MGFLTDALQKIQTELDDSGISSSSKTSSSKRSTGSRDESSSSSSSSSSMSMASVMHYDSNATRWEKAVVGVDTIVSEVVKFDPDGVDIVMVGGSTRSGGIATASTTINEEESEALTMEDDSNINNDVEWYRNIQTTKGLEELVTSKGREPNGDCPLGKAMEEVLTEALSKDLTKTPCSVLVLTAGTISDSDLLETTLQQTAQTIADSGGLTLSPLSVTFIQIGNDEDASKYLQYLDKKIGTATTSSLNRKEDESESERERADQNNKIDIVDTMSYEEIKDTMDGMSKARKDAKKSGSNGKNGALVGAVAGAALGMGGMYLASKQKAKKRIKSGSWEGKWKCYYGDEEIATLDVNDDKNGNITIDGLVDTMHGTYNNNDNDNDELVIQFTDPTGEVVTGEFNDKLYILEWSDGTRWEALNKTNWGGYVASATLGAALVGGTGYAIDKKFFNKMKAKDQCDYIIVVDRSINMAQRDK